MRVARAMAAEYARPRAANAIMLAALCIGLGNVASRLLGLVRVSAVAAYFGRGPAVDAYAAAWTVPNTVYDILISGMASAAVVPVLSAYAEGDQREFRQIVGSLFSIVLLALLALSLLLAWQTPLVVRLLVRESQPALFAATVRLVRLLLPAVLVLGLSGVATAALYAQRAFLWPAFAGAAFNLGMIIGVVLLHDRLGVTSLAAGALIGALGQLALQAVGLRKLRLALTLGLHHPALRRMLRLCAPVVLGIMFFIAGTLLDRWLASGFPTALATMQYATTLVQFPLGLVAAAVALAVLPTLARQSAAVQEAAFRQTLALGLKLVLLLIVPAAIGLAALAGPIAALLFERGAFVGSDTTATAQALLCYLPGMPATAVAQVLLFALYARQRTLAPNVVQGAAIIVYLLVALPLLWLTRLGFLALVLGNAAQWIGHMLLLLLLLGREVSLRGLRIGEALGKSALAGTLMAATMLGLVAGLAHAQPLIQLAVAGGLGALLYVSLCLVLRVEALGFVIHEATRRAAKGWGRDDPRSDAKGR